VNTKYPLIGIYAIIKQCSINKIGNAKYIYKYIYKNICYKLIY